MSDPIVEYAPNIPDLLQWYHREHRPMPWRETKNPYYIWISEIMLQQTRVDQALPYFERFIHAFPTVESLARADQQEVLMLWEGLGYYSRARNIHKAAKQILSECEGSLPPDYEALRSLPGIGPYTAAAIASIAFKLEHAVMDGNVIRVVSRYIGLEEDTRKNATRSRIQKVVDEWIIGHPPDDFNQAIMELGATVCTPHKPACEHCPLSAQCVAFTQSKTERIPYASKKAKRPHHHISVAIIRNEQNQLLIAQRPEEAMLGGLWEFPGGKQEAGESSEEALIREIKEELGVEITILHEFMQLDHAYSHFTIHMTAYLCAQVDASATPEPKASQQIRWISIDELTHYPFPKANRLLTLALIDEFA